VALPAYCGEVHPSCSDVCPVVAAGGGAILAVLSPGLSGLCLAIFTTLWGFTIIYGSYSRHSQRVVQVRKRTARALPQRLSTLGRQTAAGWPCYCAAAYAGESVCDPPCWFESLCCLLQDVLASSTACAEEALVASKVVRTFGTEQKEQDRYMTWLE
jgi:hypothetical protein